MLWSYVNSPLVRRELIVALSKLVNAYFENCKEVAIEMREEHKRTEEADKSLKKKRKEQKKHNRLRKLSFFFPCLFLVLIIVFLMQLLFKRTPPLTQPPRIQSSQVSMGGYGKWCCHSRKTLSLPWLLWHKLLLSK